MKFSLLSHGLKQHNETLRIKTLSHLIANTPRGTAGHWEQPPSAAVSLQMCWRSDLQQPLMVLNFISHTTTKAICFPISFGKQVTTSQGLGDSNRNRQVILPAPTPSVSLPSEELLTQNIKAKLWSVALKESQALPYLPSQTGSGASPLSDKAWLSHLPFGLQLRPLQRDQK